MPADAPRPCCKAHEALRAVEWSGEWYSCPACCKRVHSFDCLLAAALAEPCCKPQEPAE